MRNLLITLVLVTVAAVAQATSTNPFPSPTAATQSALKPFARDLGGLLGSASAHTGRTLGFPGFWVGGIVSTQFKPEKDDEILNAAGVKGFGVPMVEAGVGLPLDIDVIVHGVKANSTTIFGGGVRRSLYRTDMIDAFLPNVSIAAFGDKVNAPEFNAAHLGLDATATWSLPIIKPMLIAGYDLTKVTVASSVPTIGGISANGSGSRLGVGAELTPFPFVGLRAVYSLRHGTSGLDLGLGVKF